MQIFITPLVLSAMAIRLAAVYGLIIPQMINIRPDSEVHNLGEWLARWVKRRRCE